MTSHSNNEFFSYEDENAQMSSDDVCRVTWARDYKGKNGKSRTMQRLYRRVNAYTFPQPQKLGKKKKKWVFNNEEVWRFNHLKSGEITYEN
mgnify:FL=1|jgi:predicted DNA-binding transcriptional regulator AlpA|tara:strand:+ start:2342 stop:2614 length:273 start_codon:yes stop_codon:yes gene_type:complete